MAEKKYIEIEAAIEAIKSLYPSVPFVKLNIDKWHEKNKAYMECEIAIESIPAADVVPVVRGKWVNDHNGKYSASGDNFYCSICKDPSLRAFGKPAKTNYCPNCGAKMEA